MATMTDTTEPDRDRDRDRERAADAARKALDDALEDGNAGGCDELAAAMATVRERQSG